MSDSNAVVLRYVPETTYGETPVDSTDWKTLRWTSETFTASPETTQSSEIRQDRAVSDMPKVNTTVNGGFNFEFSANTFDEFVEAALGGTWAQDGVNLWDIVEQGTTYRSFSVEKEYSDLTKFVGFKGMRVGTFNFSLAFGSIITGDVGLAGSDGVTATTSLVGAGSTAPATTTPLMTASSDVGSVKIDGVEATVCLTGLDLSIDNNLRAINCIGRDTPKDQKIGTCNISGTATMYLDADAFALYQSALANSEASLEYTVTDGTNSFTIFLPRIKLSGDTPQAGGLDQDVPFNMTFMALIDDVEGTPIRITRTPNVV